MYNFTPLSVLALIYLLPQTINSQKPFVSIPAKLPANSDITLQIDTELLKTENKDENEMGKNPPTHYSLLLHPPDTSYDPGASSYDDNDFILCFLADKIKIEVSEVTVRIPSNVGSEGKSFAMVAVAYKYNASSPYWRDSSDDNELDVMGNKYSTNFKLEGADGKKIDMMKLSPLYPYLLGYFAFTPCEAIACVKDCTQRIYNEIPDRASKAAFLRAWKCWKECPGANYPPLSTVMSGFDDEVEENVSTGSGTTIPPVSASKTATPSQSSSKNTISPTESAVSTSGSAVSPTVTPSAAINIFSSFSATLVILGFTTSLACLFS